MDKFAIWFTGAIFGNWIVWATYMALKFMTEAAQHQYASMSLHQADGQVGAFILLPIFISIIGTILWTVFIVEGLD